MQAIREKKLLWVLVALFLLTALSSVFSVLTSWDSKTLGVVITLIAFLKVRLIIIHYMEAYKANLPIRLAFELWVVIAAAGTIALYLQG